MGWRSLTATLTGERVLTHNLIVASGTITAGALGVAFQALVSHQLRPADYGGVFAVVTLITLLGVPAGAFTLLMAREASRDLAAGQHARSTTLLCQGNRVLVLAGLGVATVLVLASPFLGSFLDIPRQLLVAAAAGIPFALALPLLVGEFQGKQRFATFALLSIGQAGLKLIGAVGLGYFLGPLGIVAGISLATVIIYLVAFTILRGKLLATPTAAWFRPAASYLAIVLPSTLALSILLSSDVLLVKHYFPTRVAGEYSAVAALGRAVFWGATGVAAVLFPKVIFRGVRGLSGSHVVNASLLLVVLGGLSGLGLLTFGSRWLLSAFAGSAYAGAAVYLPWYAVGMTLLGGVAVLIAVHQSLGKPGFLAILLPLTILEPALLLVFHENLGQVVQVVDASMALILAALGALYLLQDRIGGLASVRVPATAAATSSNSPVSLHK